MSLLAPTWLCQAPLADSNVGRRWLEEAEGSTNLGLRLDRPRGDDGATGDRTISPRFSNTRFISVAHVDPAPYIDTSTSAQEYFYGIFTYLHQEF
jgi:hypothetical protein